MPDRIYVANSFYNGMPFHYNDGVSSWVIIVDNINQRNRTLEYLWVIGISTLLEADIEKTWNKSLLYQFDEWKDWILTTQASVTLLVRREPDWEV